MDPEHKGQGQGHNQDNKLKITVHTGEGRPYLNRRNLFLTLHDEHGNTSEKISVPMGMWKTGSEHEFVVPEEKLKTMATGAKIDRVDLDTTSKCYVKRIQVKNAGTNANIGVFRRIKTNSPLSVPVDGITSLPQSDGEQRREQRRTELTEKRKEYQYLQDQDNGLPAQVRVIPPDESFTLQYKLFLLIALLGTMLIRVRNKVSGAWYKLWYGKPKTIQDLKTVYAKWTQFAEPEGLWKWIYGSNKEKDAAFANQRLNGLNPTVIRLVKSMADIKKIPVTDKMLGPFLKGLTVEAAVEQKRLFLCDLEILKDVKGKLHFKLCAPVALFFLDNGLLMPVAIQLFQNKSEDNPVFLPSDGCNWTLAKMWYNNADAAYHQAIAHLGFTHLLMEGVAVATNRQLSRFHPIYKLLAPHFLFLIAINTKAREGLISEGGIIDRIMTAGVRGTFEIIKKRLERWQLSVDGTLPEELAQRGVDSPDILPNYHFRDDALRVYDAIHKYVSDYVNLYYANPENLQKDWEIQAWVKELTAPRNAGEGGCGLKGVPGDGRLDNAGQLIAILTSVIYTCSVGHAAANFGQYDEYGFLPNYPGLLRGQPPRDKSTRSEQEILGALPDNETIHETMQVTKLLSMRDTKQLGDFHEVPTITDSKGLVIVDDFNNNLREVSRNIQEENLQRWFQYKHVDPAVVPNAISI